MTPPRPVIVGTGIAGLWTRLAAGLRRATAQLWSPRKRSPTAPARGPRAASPWRSGPATAPASTRPTPSPPATAWPTPKPFASSQVKAPDRIYELLALGARFDRGPDGRLGFGLEAAHTRPRIIHAGGDRTGAALIGCLAQVVRSTSADRAAGAHRGHRAPPRRRSSRRRCGAACGTRRGSFRASRRRAGHRRRGSAVRDHHQSEGGHGGRLGAGAPGRRPASRPRVPPVPPHRAQAARASTPLRSSRRPCVAPAPSLWTGTGTRFALDADPRGELAPRDVVARAVAAADAAGGAWLDARDSRGLPHPVPRHHHHAQLRTDSMLRATSCPVAPALHYAMGGVRRPISRGAPPCRGSGRSARWPPPACTAPTGWRRTRCSRDWSSPTARAVRWRTSASRRYTPSSRRTFHSQRETGADARLRAHPARACARSMTADVGVQRTESSLLHAEQELARLTRETPADAWRTHNQLLVARLITQAARRRRESRGGHRRPDYPPAGLSGRPHDPGRPDEAAATSSASRHRAHPRDPGADRRAPARDPEARPAARRRRAGAQLPAAGGPGRRRLRGRLAGPLPPGGEDPADVIIFCGVHFMAETAAILSPDKRVLLPDLRPAARWPRPSPRRTCAGGRRSFPDYIAVGYVNTTAEVKAELDYCCTSGNVLDVIDAIPADKGILFLPDFFLGAHVRRMRPDRRIEVWMGECHVHSGIRAETLNAARAAHPDAEVLVHPECGCAGQLIYEMGQGDVSPKGLHIASTEGMIRAVTERRRRSSSSPPRPGSCTACGRWRPAKQFIAADPEAVCAYMKTITLTGVRDSLAARPVSHHRPSRHRGARPRGDRPHGRARPVTRGRRAHRGRCPRRGRRDRHHHRRSPCPPASPARA